MTDVQEDYPELEGMEFDFIDDVGFQIGRLIGCNRNVGLTIVNAEDEREKLLCFKGPSTKGSKSKDKELDMMLYDIVVEGVREGKVDWRGIKRNHDGCSPKDIGDGVNACAFNM